MPDAHLGAGAMVGSVVATKNAIIPSAVGVDIGCGMMARKTPFKSLHLEGKLPQIRHDIERSIPVGFSKNQRLDDSVQNWEGWKTFSKLHPDIQDKMGNSMEQLGSLGGGNHFIEVCLDTEDNVWLLLHSGSRNIGKELADRHINNAKGLFKQSLLELPDPNLSYLVAGTADFAAYWNDLQWAQAYAMKNREVMMDRLIRVMQYQLNNGEPFEIELSVNCHHNYAELETHYGEDVYVTRKGAVRADKDDYGIIPGSMGARSFIVKGKGNAESFHSCSHGAGRTMSRTKAKEIFTLEDLKKQTEGIECRKDKGVIDEIPGAYKDIEMVMKAQDDLVEIVAELRQVVCVKG
jgi:tRNA-splicing ligase RtcB